VINKSQRVLKEAETSVLAKGLNFAIAPRKQQIAEIVTNLECAAHFLPVDQKDSFRFEIRKAIDKPKKPKNNLTRQEELALESLTKDENIVIMPADKGKAAVIMDTTEYTHKKEEILADTSDAR